MNSIMNAGLSLNANGGFLCLSTYWRPNPSDKNPEMPGNKVIINSYIPLRPIDACLCGSEKKYSDCCQPQQAWHSICPNPGLIGYSLLAPQSVTYHSVRGAEIRDQLIKDSRLYCVENNTAKSFLVYWGTPVIKTDYGILCFGDIELHNDDTLLVRAMSHKRMSILLALLNEITKDELRNADINYEKIDGYIIDKLKYSAKKQKTGRKGKQPRRKR